MDDSIPVHSGDVFVGVEVLDDGLDFFRAKAQVTYGGSAAGRTTDIACRGETAIVTAISIGLPVICQGYIAIFALERFSAGATNRQARKPPAIKE